ncbi:hypothetical protein ACFQ2J_14525 [Thalassobacillus hwangdonensis]|uniref:Uncharacterized protein n=1 Tax=Thalassobacillus hwangdonensis TaxID=546108 RepID=A0ABW3L321_9BACI
MGTEKVSGDRRIHIFDMAEQRKISFNYASIKRSSVQRAGEELSRFLETKSKKIDRGFYDNKGRAS